MNLAMRKRVIKLIKDRIFQSFVGEGGLFHMEIDRCDMFRSGC